MEPWGDVSLRGDSELVTLPTAAAVFEVGRLVQSPNAKHIGVFLMLQSLFIHVHPASRIRHRTCLEDIWWAHRWCDMKHFILYKTRTSKFSSLQCFYSLQAFLYLPRFVHQNGCREHYALVFIPIHILPKTLCATVEDDEKLNNCPLRLILSAYTEPMTLQQKRWGTQYFEIEFTNILK